MGEWQPIETAPKDGTAIWLVRAFRWMPRTWAFDKHLDDCAALQVLYHPFNGAAPLEIAHVLKIKSLPNFYPDISPSLLGRR